MISTIINGLGWIDPETVPYIVTHEGSSEIFSVDDKVILVGMKPLKESQNYEEHFSSKLVNVKWLKDKKEGDTLSLKLSNNVILNLELSNIKAYEVIQNPPVFEEVLELAMGKISVKKDTQQDPEEEKAYLEFFTKNLEGHLE